MQFYIIHVFGVPYSWSFFFIFSCAFLRLVRSFISSVIAHGIAVLVLVVVDAAGTAVALASVIAFCAHPSGASSTPNK